MAAHPGTVLAAVEDAYRQLFKVSPARASVSFVGVEAIEVLRFNEGNGFGGLSHYVSLGMSRYPMADPSEFTVEDAVAPRAELLISARGAPDGLWRQLAILAAAPAVEGAVYGPGNRVDINQPLVAGSRCTGGVVVAGPLPPIAVAGIADVELLQILPATANELAWARVHGSEKLVQRWAAAGVPLDDLMRDEVALS